MSDLLSTSVTGLLAFQRALSTTGHNIANANTEGYSRQRADLTAAPPQYFGGSFIGSGVRVASIERIQDEFLNLQVRTAGSESSRLDSFYALSSKIDGLLADTETGLPNVLQDFFASVQEVANDPTSAAARQVLLGNAGTLTDRFHFIDGQLNSLNHEINTRLGDSVNEINVLADNIAKLNKTIVQATGQAGGAPPNDLLDQRDQLITELSGLVSVNVVPQDDGAVNVFIGNGQALVMAMDARPLSLVTDPADASKSQIAHDGGAGQVIISNQLSGGTVGGLLDFRREVLGDASNALGRIAAVLADSFNNQHSAGMDLNGDMGADFFTMPVPQVISNKTNAGGATVSAAINDASSLTTSDYRLSYDGSNYNLTRLSDNTQVSGPGPLLMDGFEVSVSGAAVSGDSYLIRPVGSAARDIVLAITDTNRIAAASPVRSEALVSNLGNAGMSQANVIDASDSALLNSVEIQFNNPATNFDVVDTVTGTTLAAGVAYTSGGLIQYNGWQATISGDPVAGDTFRIEQNTGGGSDNRNALTLAGLQSESLIGGSASYQEGYGALVGRVGSVTRQAEINSHAQTGLLQHAVEARDSVSGVNLDEEAINLTRYQQAYQAAAQVITTADSLFQTLLNAVSR